MRDYALFIALILSISLNVISIGMNTVILSYMTDKMVWDLDRLRNDYLDNAKRYVYYGCTEGTDYVAPVDGNGPGISAFCQERVERSLNMIMSDLSDVARTRARRF